MDERFCLRTPVFRHQICCRQSGIADRTRINIYAEPANSEMELPLTGFTEQFAAHGDYGAAG